MKLRREACVSFQITILKVLAGHPGGRLALADLTRAVALLMSSGSDWTDRMKRLAGRAPDLDIFSQSYVLRHDAGWQITDAGQAFLASLERPGLMTTDVDQPEGLIIAPATPMPASPAPIRLVVRNRRRPRPHGLAGRKRPSAVA